ncbi:hypothetical protein N665_0002s0136 [Sinapis alba]|nr:hypothetical protein N665_0002s0136 [Sinapis alba]
MILLACYILWKTSAKIRAEGFKNIPWTLILQMGKGVFKNPHIRQEVSGTKLGTCSRDDAKHYSLFRCSFWRWKLLLGLIVFFVNITQTRKIDNRIDSVTV